MDLTFDNEPSELRQVLERLNKIPRTGWLKSGVPLEKCETVGQHTHGVMNIVAELARSRADVRIRTCGFNTVTYSQFID